MTPEEQVAQDIQRMNKLLVDRAKEQSPVFALFWANSEEAEVEVVDVDSVDLPPMSAMPRLLRRSGEQLPSYELLWVKELRKRVDYFESKGLFTRDEAEALSKVIDGIQGRVDYDPIQPRINAFIGLLKQIQQRQTATYSFYYKATTWVYYQDVQTSVVDFLAPSTGSFIPRMLQLAIQEANLPSNDKTFIRLKVKASMLSSMVEHGCYADIRYLSAVSSGERLPEPPLPRQIAQAIVAQSQMWHQQTEGQEENSKAVVVWQPNPWL